MADFLTELKKRHVFRVAIGYGAVAWVIAQVAEFALDTFEAPDWVLKSLVIVLLLGLPVAIFLAWAYEITPAGVKRDEDVERAATESDVPRRGRRRPVLLAVVVLLAAAVTYVLYDYRQSENAVQAALAELAVAHELTAQDRFAEAFAIVQRLSPVIGNTTEVRELLQDITIEIDPRVVDEGALVSFRPYDVPDAEWVRIDRTSGEPARAPIGGLLLRIEKPGYVTRDIAVANPGPMLNNVDPIMMEAAGYPIPEINIYETGVVTDDMVRVPATDLPVYITGFALDALGDQRFRIPAFDIDRNEVTNREFKAFVDAGGYSNPAYWQGIQQVDGSSIDEATIATFVDTTGRPGPSTWELGNYPSGTADMPVGGISLYEAKAYARYRGMALPTIHHWGRAAFAPMEAIEQIAPSIARASHFGQSSPLPADSETGIGPWGTVNMAGNAREWVWNTTDRLGIAMGGGWNNYDDMYHDVYTIDPLDRAPQNGLRLMHTLGEPVDSRLLAAVQVNYEMMAAQRDPVSDEAFEAMRFQYTHVRREPSSVSIQTVAENDTWIEEEVVLDFTGGESFTLYVVRPVNPAKTMQAVVYMPHAGAAQKMSNRRLLSHMYFMDYVVQAGRAIVIPVFDGTADRYTEAPDDEQAMKDHFRRRALARYEDIAITIDYLESREDIDADALGFLGFSYGAYMSATFLAIENRLKALVLISGGSPYWDYPHPMYDPVNYFPRMMQPVMMINGRHDHLFEYESSQLRMLELLGAPEEDKVHLVFEEGHFDFPRNTVAREVSDWLDKYLGPVR